MRVYSVYSQFILYAGFKKVGKYLICMERFLSELTSIKTLDIWKRWALVLYKFTRWVDDFGVTLAMYPHCPFVWDRKVKLK